MYATPDLQQLSTLITQNAASLYWQTAHQLGHPAALWRLPNRADKQLIVSFDDELPTVSADLDELPAGFAVSPFDNFDDEHADLAETMFLRADARFTFSDGAVIAEILPETPTGLAFSETAQILANEPRRTAVNNTATVLLDADAQGVFEQNVAEAVAQMQQGAFRKVVLSRTKTVQFAEELDVVQLFDKLCQTYPTAFVSAVWLPHLGQTWVCATPERLVSVDADGIFRTLSLAGTQSVIGPDGQLKRPADALWSQKEIEEQALVSRYIIGCFKKIRLREYLEEGPKTVVAGNLMHLGSYFSVDTQAVRYLQLGTVMLRLLHPTSAVCGMPRKPAFDFILQHETHARELYAGFLGPINIDYESHLFVQLRCLKLEGQTATLFAGAGLTEDSIPNREWLETEMKCQTLLAVIGV
jgi:isochorismate synthase